MLSERRQTHKIIYHIHYHIETGHIYVKYLRKNIPLASDMTRYESLISTARELPDLSY